MSAKEPLVLNLESGEKVAHLAATGSTLAIGAGYRGSYDRSKSVAEQSQCLIVLVRDGSPPTRTPVKHGAMRSLVSIPTGFLAGRVVYDHEGHTITHVFEVDLKGEVTEMPPLPIDLAGLWADKDGAVFAYDWGTVFRWSAAKPTWEKLPLDPEVNAEAIRRIVTLNSGSSLVVTDRVFKGFKSLQEPPIFVRDLNTYPEAIYAFGNDQWWIMTSDGSTHKISTVSRDGRVQEAASLRVVNPHELLFSGDKVFVVCAREGGNVHKYSYYVLNRDGTGPLRGPFMLPDDTMSTCIWGDSIVSGGAASRVFKTAIDAEAK